jgi:hypothetical protein
MRCRSCQREIPIGEDFIIQVPIIKLGKKVLIKNYKMNLKGIEEYAEDPRCEELWVYCEKCFRRKQ